MLFTEMTIEDLMILRCYQLDRLYSFFHSSLEQCYIYIDLKNTLNVHCQEPAIVDNLLFDLDDLCDLSWLILGADAIALFFQTEEIYRRNYQQSGTAVFDKIIE